MRTIACISLLLAAAGCDKATEPGFCVGPEPAQNTIAYLKSLCDGKTSVAVTQDITVSGFITGNDLYGEFYKTIVVEDDSGGITIAADHPALAREYPFGAVATVRCNGLVLCNYGGKVELGTTPGENGPGRIPRDELARYIRVSLPENTTHRAPTISLGEIAARHIDTRVCIEGVHFTEAGNWCNLDPVTNRPVATERQIADARGRTFRVRTAGTCIYAKEPVPQGTGSLYGIIDYFNETYTLRVTNRGAVFSGTTQ